MKTVVIIGGGITGLSAAFALQLKARIHNRPLHIVLIEAAEHLGGKIQTDYTNGYVIEKGPDSIFTPKPWAVDLAKQLHMEDRIVSVAGAGRSSYIVRNGRLVTAPQGWTRLTRDSMVQLAKSPLISWPGKLRMAMDYLIRPPRLDPSANEHDESIGSFFSRRMGREIVDYLVEPLMAGINAGDIDRLSLRATFPHFADLEQKHGSLIRAALATKQPNTKPGQLGTTGPFVSFKNGLSEFIEKLRDCLDDVTIQTGDAVGQIERISGDGESYRIHLENGNQIDASGIIITTPAYTAAKLLDPLSPEATELLQRIRHESVITVALVYDAVDVPQTVQGSGFIIPTHEIDVMTACTWYSMKWPHSVPSGKFAIRAHLGRANHPAPLANSDEQIVTAVQSDIKKRLRISAQPEYTLVNRWPDAMPQYEVGHRSLIASIEQRLEPFPYLFLAGSDYKGSGISDCVRQGNEVAEKMITTI